MTNVVAFFEVGGAVRDRFLGIESNDMDFAVEAPSFESMRERILDLGGRIFLESPQHFTIRANVPEMGACDFVWCFRTESGTVEAGTIFTDLACRDFTVNAIAVCCDDQNLIDPFNGRSDLEARVIRCVGSPERAFTDDPVRMLRALRFCLTRGFVLAEDTAAALRDANIVSGLAGVAQDRIREEVGRLFRADTFAAVNILAQFPLVLQAVSESGVWLRATQENRG